MNTIRIGQYPHLNYPTFDGILELYSTKSKCEDIVILRKEDGEKNSFMVLSLLSFYNFTQSEEIRIGTYHEQFMYYDGARSKIFLDLDFIGTLANVSKTYSYADSIKLIKKAVKKVFDDEFDIELTNDDLLTFISEKMGNKKIGCHLIIAPTKYCFNCLRTHAFIVERIKNCLPEEIKYAVDPIQNKRKNGSLRILGSSKPDGRMKCHQEGNVSIVKIPDALLYSESIEEIDHTHIKTLFASLISYTRNLEVLCKTDLPEIVQYNNGNHEMTGVDLKTILQHPSMEKFNKIYTFVSERGNFINFRRLLPEHCNYCNRIHENDNCIYLLYSEYKGQVSIYKKCFKTKSDFKQSEIMMKFTKEIKKDGSVSTIQRVIDDEEYSINKFKSLMEEDSLTLNENYFKTFEDTYSYAYFNKFHLYMPIQNRMYLINKNQDPVPYNIHLPIGYSVIETTEKGKLIPHNFFKLWMTSKNKKEIGKFVFNPNPNYILNKDEHNLFGGFKYDLEDYDDELDIITSIQPFIDHVKNLCNNDEKVSEYLLNWFAHIFQKPHIKTTTAVLLYSETEGVGKNITLDIIKKSMGEHLFLEIGNTREINAKFNSTQKNKLLVVGNEINAHAKTESNEFKDMITRSKMRVELKGVDAMILDDFTNWLFTSNNEQVIKVLRTDRRYMLIECIDKKLSEEMVNKLKAMLENEDALKNLYYYFMIRDISKFNPQRDLVMTEYKMNLIKNDLPTHIHMMKFKSLDFVKSGKIFTSDLINSVKQYGKDNKMSVLITDNKITKDFVAVFGEYKTSNTKKSEYDFSKIIDSKDFNERIDDIINKKYISV